MENQYHPLWGIPNLGGMDCHDYVMDWLQGLFSGKRVPKKAGRIAYVGEQGDGPWSPCDPDFRSDLARSTGLAGNRGLTRISDPDSAHGGRSPCASPRCGADRRRRIC